jgi:hypothetical protein
MMEKLRYEDFDLKIEKKGKGYLASVLKSPAGEASATFKFPFSTLELENLILKLVRVRSGSRRIDSPEMAAAKQLGGKLFESVLGGDVLACMRRSLDAVSSREGTGLRVRMRLQDVPELADLPWEFLYNPSRDLFLAQSTKTPVVRYIEMPEVIPALAADLPLNMLVMISSPKEYVCLNVEQEKANLQKALAPLIDRGVLKIRYLEDAQLPSLRRVLKRDTFHIFHFIGHGGFDRHAQQGVLVLEGDREQGVRVEAQHIGQILNDHQSLRLVVLNACDGARNSRDDPFSGVAATMIRQGIPAVVAMQFEISDDAAIRFATEFYSAMVDGFPVDAAVTEARKSIREMSPVEWGTPVLYMRSPDGALFDLPDQAAPEPEHTELTKTAETPVPADAGRDARPASARPPAPEVKPAAAAPLPALAEVKPEPAPPPEKKLDTPHPELEDNMISKVIGKKYLWMGLILLIISLSFAVYKIMAPTDVDKGNEFFDKKNYDEALKYYGKAAAKNDSWAQLRLGWMAENGYGSRKDNALAKYWYGKAAELGNSQAKAALERLNTSPATPPLPVPPPLPLPVFPHPPAGKK